MASRHPRPNPQPHPRSPVPALTPNLALALTFTFALALTLTRTQVGEAYFQPGAAKLAREGDLMLACIDHPFTSGEDSVATWLQTERFGGTSLSDMHRSSESLEAPAPSLSLA